MNSLARFCSLAAVSAAAIACSWGAHAETPNKAPPSSPVSVQADGTITVKEFQLPVSNLLSPEGKEAQREFLLKPHPMNWKDPIAWRKQLDEEHIKPTMEAWRKLYPVKITEQRTGGVMTDVLVPEAGVAESNRNRVLIHLHGGGFMVGGRLGGQVESIPVVGIGKVKVVTVDYRMFPEARHPAAIEDSIAVYREMLKTYKPENIGIFGCSAGGILTAQVTAALQIQKLPRPGAIGIFCHGAGVLAGDSNYLGGIASGMAPPSVQPPANDAKRLGYFANADLKDPTVSPVDHPEVLRQFPPTLILTGTRDFVASSAIRSHALLRKANVDAQLYVMEGLGHGAHVSLVGTPEAVDANTEIWKFFDAHLGK